MKYILYILSIFLGSQLMAQDDWGNRIYEEGSKYHFDSGMALYEAVNNVLKIDDRLTDLDTSILKNRIEFHILNDQKKLLLQRALTSFEVAIDDYPESLYFIQAIQYKGKVLIGLNELDRARTYFIQLIERDIPFKTDITNATDSRYYDFKNTIYLSLAEIEYHSANYSKAIEYLDLAEKFRYVYFCGGMHEYYDEEVATYYAKNYFALGNNRKAIDLVIPHIFSDGGPQYQDLINDAIKYLLQNHSRAYLIKELKSAIRNCTVGNFDGTTYKINYLGYDLEVYTVHPQIVKEFGEELEDIMKKERFYQELMKEEPTQNK